MAETKRASEKSLVAAVLAVYKNLGHWGDGRDEMIYDARLTEALALAIGREVWAAVNDR